MLRLSCLFIFFIVNAFAIDVVVTNKDINFNEIINSSMVNKSVVKSVKRHCNPVSFEQFTNKKLQATHYMRKGYVICQNDVKEYKKQSVLFDFGVIEIEKQGEVIFENDEYIRIKKSNGDIDKIYKDGRLR